MSDSMVALFSMGAMFGMFLSIFILAIAENDYKGNSGKQSDTDSDMRIYIPSRDRNRCSDKRSDNAKGDEDGKLNDTKMQDL